MGIMVRFLKTIPLQRLPAAEFFYNGNPELWLFQRHFMQFFCNCAHTNADLTDARKDEQWQNKNEGNGAYALMRRRF
jgi:hypothetical protein